MSIPNKIYLQSEKDYYLSEKWTSEPCKRLENTEYIRKDVIVSEITRRIEESDFDESANLYGLLSFLDNLRP